MSRLSRLRVRRAFAGPRGARAAAMATLLVVTVSAPTRAQSIGSPVFVAEPGIRTVDAISSNNGFGSASGFNVRFATLLPTTWRHVTLVFGAEFLPFGLSNGGRTASHLGCRASKAW